MEIRVDKWLWTMRIYKTRSIASEACKKGRISRSGTQLKPSATVRANDIIEVKKPPVIYTYKIIQLSPNRLNAKLVAEYMKDITTPEQLELIELGKIAAKTGRSRGMGRPTKKERREIDSFLDPYFLDDEDDDTDFD